MKHLIKMALVLAVAGSWCVAQDIPVVDSWDVELTAPVDHPISIMRGETKYLRTRYLVNGSAATITNLTSVQLWYKPSSLSTATWFYVTNGVFLGTGIVQIAWTPACESTWSEYNYNIASVAPSGTSMSAAGKLTLRGTVTGSATAAPPGRVVYVSDSATYITNGGASINGSPIRNGSDTTVTVSSVAWTNLTGIPSVWSGTATDDVARAAIVVETNRAQVAEATLYPRSNPSNYITAAQVPASETDPVFATNGLARSDTNGWTVSSHSTLLTSGSATINGEPITNGAAFTITGGGGGGGISNISVAGVTGTLTGSGSNIVASVSLASLAGAGVVTNGVKIASSTNSDWAAWAESATNAVTVTGAQSNLIATALQPASTQGLATVAYVDAATNAAVIDATQRVAGVGYLLPASTQNLATVAQVTAATNAIDGAFIAAKGGLTNAWQNPASASNWTWTSDGKEITLTDYSGPNAVVIPDMLDGLPVTKLADLLFRGSAITSVSNGDRITTIGLGALGDCPDLTSVSFPSATTIGDLAFTGCASLVSVTFGQDAPAEGNDVYTDTPNVTNYVTNPTATGWGTTWNGRPVVRLPVYADNFYGSGTGITGITAEQVGAVATNDTRYLTALTNAAAFVATNDTRYLASISNNQQNVTLGLASGSTVADATASNHPVSYFQFEQALVGNVEGFLSGTKTTAFTNYFDPTNFTYLVSPTNWSAAATLSIPTTTNGAYILAGISTGQTFTVLQDGTARMELWISENEAGSASVKPELYLFDTVQNALVEFGNGGSSQVVPAGATPQQLLFTVPHPMIVTNNPCYLVARLKVTALTLTPTLIVGYGDGYVTHFELSVPSSGLYAPLAHVSATGGVAHAGMATTETVSNATNLLWQTTTNQITISTNTLGISLTNQLNVATNTLGNSLTNIIRNATNTLWIATTNADNVATNTLGQSLTNTITIATNTLGRSLTNTINIATNALGQQLTNQLNVATNTLGQQLTNTATSAAAPVSYARTIANTSALTWTNTWSPFSNCASVTFTSTGVVTHLYQFPEDRACTMEFLMTATGSPSMTWPSGAVWYTGGVFSATAGTIGKSNLVSVKHTPYLYLIYALTNAQTGWGTP